MNENLKARILLLFLLFLAFFMRFHNLEARLPFGWDQARDAQVIWSILKAGKPTLIGPRVVSDDAFFLGPFWFYFLAPFFILFNMDPLSLGAVVLVSGVVTTLILFLFVKKIAGNVAALIGSFIWATILMSQPGIPCLYPPL